MRPREVRLQKGPRGLGLKNSRQYFFRESVVSSTKSESKKVTITKENLNLKKNL